VEDTPAEVQEVVADVAPESVSESVLPIADVETVAETSAESSVGGDTVLALLPEVAAPQAEGPAVEEAMPSSVDAGIAQSERAASVRELEAVRSQRDTAIADAEAAITEAETEIAELDRRHAASLSQAEQRLTAADAGLRQERMALQQQLAVVRGQRDVATTDAEARITALLEEAAETRSAALRAAEARLNQERTALQQQLAVVRAQRDAAAADTEMQIAELREEQAAALRAAGVRLDQESTALQQQLAVVRGQREAVAAEAEKQIAKLSEEQAAALRAAGARLDQERTALQQQLAVVRGQREAVAAEAEKQIAKLSEEQAAALRAAGARLDQEAPP
jgi:hypothetical protein